jgi:hypothetical protein
MKQIFTDIISRLGEVKGLKYIDKDWGQLSLENPAAKFPCALVDIASVAYTNRADNAQMADGILNVTIAGLRLSPSSSMAQSRGDAWMTLDLIRDVNDALHLWHTDHFSRLIRQQFAKVDSSPGYDCYVLSYHITWWDYPQPHPKQAEAEG